MKRMHVHVAVDDLKRSIGFYSALFAAEPAVTKADYAKWMLDDPRVNFAISTRGRQAGLDHLGIQVENKGELDEIYARLHKAGGNVIEQAKQVAVTPSLKSPGSTTLQAFRGKRFSRRAKTLITATAAASAARGCHEKSCCAPRCSSGGLLRLSGPVSRAMIEQCCASDRLPAIADKRHLFAAGLDWRDGDCEAPHMVRRCLQSPRLAGR